MVLRGRYAATRGGDVGNDKLRFDFISRGDDRHHGGNRGRKKKKETKLIVRSKLLFTRSMSGIIFFRITLHSVILLLYMILIFTRKSTLSPRRGNYII